MIEANCLVQTSGGKTAAEKIRTMREPLAGHALKPLAPLTSDDATGAAAHPATRGICGDDHDRPAAVPAHLSLLRDALARGEDLHARTSTATGAESGQASPHHRRPFRAAPTTRITLSQWVSKTTSYVA
ncbi:hypothetical protein WJM95_32960 [Streptomyces sp. f51]|uniref:hypothetical protein n=1 Tax=Streptomyces sp. f51 TaxID=1827742 RepID=UPI0030D0E923